MTTEEYQAYTENLITAISNCAKLSAGLAEVEKRFLSLQHKIELAEVYKREAEILKPHEN